MATQVQTFDPVKYKATTRELWQNAAEAWSRWEPTLKARLGPATVVMLDLADIGPGKIPLANLVGGSAHWARTAT